MIERVLEYRIKVWTVLVLALSVVVYERSFLFNLNGTTFEVLGIIVAIVIFLASKSGERKQALISLWEQLWVIFSWLSGPKREYKGWSSQDSSSSCAHWIWSNPFQEVFKTEDRVLPSVWANPGVANLPAEIVKNLNLLNQRIVTFNGYLGTISSFKFSAGSDTLTRIAKIYSDLENIGRVSPNDKTSCREAIQTLDQHLSQEDVAFREILVQMYQMLHEKMIGDESTSQEGIFILWKMLAMPIYMELKKIGYSEHDENRWAGLRKIYSSKEFKEMRLNTS